MSNINFELKMFFLRKTYPVIRPYRMDTPTYSFYGNINLDGTLHGLIFSWIEDTFFYVSKNRGKIELSKNHIRNLDSDLKAAMRLVAEDRKLRETPNY